MRIGVRMAAALVAAAALVPAAGSASDTLRIGVLALTQPSAEERAVGQTLERLKATLPGLRFEVRPMSNAQLREATAREALDLFISSSGFFWEMQAQHGAHAVATLASRRAPDPDAAVSGVFFVRADSPVQSLADLRGRRAAVTSRDAFLNCRIAMGEIAARGIRPERFFSALDEVGRPMRRVLEAVESGRADAGVLRACFLEDFFGRDEKALARYRILGARTGDGLACRHSAALYPGWTIGATRCLSPQATRQILAALLALEPVGAEGSYWTIATRFDRVSDLYRNLRVGP